VETTRSDHNVLKNVVGGAKKGGKQANGEECVRLVPGLQKMSQNQQWGVKKPTTRLDRVLYGKKKEKARVRHRLRPVRQKK